MDSIKNTISCLLSKEKNDYLRNETIQKICGSDRVKLTDKEQLELMKTMKTEIDVINNQVLIISEK